MIRASAREVFTDMMNIRVEVSRQGMTLINLPLLAAAVVLIAAPQLAVIGLIAALLTGCTFRIERDPERNAVPYYDEHYDSRM